jgi:hypothetical protein
MKRSIFFISGFLLIFATLGLSQAVFAQTDQQLTASQEAAVTRSCKSAQQQIKRVQQQDTITRTNRGRAYQGTILELMASLNSRVVLNKGDASKLIEVTNTLQSRFAEFYNDFTKYDAKMGDLITFTDCQSQPAVFYASLTQARGMRLQLADDTKAMDQLISDYAGQVDTLQANLTAGKTGNSQ